MENQSHVPFSGPRPTLLSVCEGCCCGHPEKGNPRVDKADFAHRLQAAGLTNVKMDFPYCLGPCHLANVVRLQVGRSTFVFSRIRDDVDRQAVVQFLQNPSRLPAQLEGKLVVANRIPE
jgi:hypothetical protein